MANQGLGVTIGSHSLRAIKLRKKGEQYVVQRVFDDRLDDTTRKVAGRALDARGFRGTPCTVGLTGRDVIIRYTQVPPVPDWRLRTLMKFEVEEVSSQSGGDVSADYKVLNLPDPDGERSDDTILVALARNTHIDALSKSLDSGGMSYGEGVPNSVSLFNAFAANATYTDEETALLVNIGAENVDMAIQRGGELVFARNATGAGGNAFTDAIKNAFSTSESKAEKMKRTKGDVTPKGQAKYPDPTAEKVANAIMGVAGQLSSLIQSTLMIARAQTRLMDLKIDRVMLAGGGASLKGLDLYLHQAMGIPVERFNPLELCDLSQLDDEEKQMLEERPHEFAVAVGLAQNQTAAEAFVLSVMPEALRRKRDFMTKGIYAAAAAVVMLGVLFLIYNGRRDAAAEYKASVAKVKAEERDVTSADNKLRKVLKIAQGAEVKHRLLAEQLAPGVLLTDVWAEIEKNVTPHIYLYGLQLNVSKPAYHFGYVVPKGKKPGSGYNRVERQRGALRNTYVQIQGRISGGSNQAAIYRKFVEGLQANKRGLSVETKGTLRKRGKENTFELEIYPGVILKPIDDKATEVTLREIQLESEDGKPVAFVGRRADGVLMKVPVDEVNKRQRKNLIENLKP